MQASMKFAVALGVLGFLLGAATAPRAANDKEMRAMLCARFTAAGGPARIHEIRVTIAKLAVPQEAHNAEANALETIDRTLCR